MTSFLLLTDYAGQGARITNPIVLAPLIIFIISLVSLIYIETHISSNPMLAPALFKKKGVTPLYLVQALLMAAQFSVGTFSLQSLFSHSHLLISLPIIAFLNFYVHDSRRSPVSQPTSSAPAMSPIQLLLSSSSRHLWATPLAPTQQANSPSVQSITSRLST